MNMEKLAKDILMPVYKDLIRTVELNGGHIDIYKNSVIFHDDVAEKCWEYEWKDLYRLTRKDT